MTNKELIEWHRNYIEALREEIADHQVSIEKTLQMIVDLENEEKQGVTSD